VFSAEDYPDIHSALSAKVQRREKVGGCSHSHQRRHVAPCRIPECGLSTALGSGIEHINSITAHSSIMSVPRITTRGSAPSGTRPVRYGSEVPRIPRESFSSEPAPPPAWSAHPRIRTGRFQDCLTVEPDRDPGAGALDLDRVPLGSRPRRVGGRALVSIILRSSLDARASVLSRAMSGQPGPMTQGQDSSIPASSRGFDPRGTSVGTQPSGYRARASVSSASLVRSKRNGVSET
jgi:hypothetical protein